MKKNNYIKVKFSKVTWLVVICFSIILIVNGLLLICYLADNFSLSLSGTDWQSIDVIITAILSLLLIIQGFYIFYRQNKDKKEMSLREERMQLHQERLNVYIEYSNILQVLSNGEHGLLETQGLIDGKEAAKMAIDLVSRQKDALYASYRKSILLFSNDKELIEYLGEIYKTFARFYNAIMHFYSNEAEFHNQALQYVQENEIDIPELKDNPEEMQKFLSALKEADCFKAFYELSDELVKELTSQKFIDMFSKHLAPDSKNEEENNSDK